MGASIARGGAFRRLLVWCVCLLGVVAGVSGCARREPSRVVRVAVLDGAVTYEVDPQGEVSDRGWWFSARDRYQSPNAGVQMGEALARELGRVPGVDVYSREDLAIYMAQKERLLKRNFPDLTSYERKQLLAKQDPLDYGRSLNVDYVVTTDIERARTIVNRTFSWWYSQLEATVQVWDVSTGQMVWTKGWEDADNFDSQLALIEECARETRREIERRDVFRVE